MSDKITYEDFLEKVNEILDEENIGQRYTPYCGAEFKDHDDWLCVYWKSGGSTGASCWGTKSYPVDPDPPEELTALDFVLAELAPKVSFLEYRKLRAKLLKTDTCTDSSDYYGNYTVYAYQAIAIKELYDYLIENELI